MMALNNQDIFFITDIPTSLKTADLRRIFSQHIEAGAFECFHYRHRPASSHITLAPHSSISAKMLLRILRRHRSRRTINCTALIAIKPDNTQKILNTLEDSWYTDAKCGNFAPCKLHRVRHAVPLLETLKKLCEFSPPSWMPQGNVGTPISHFISLIRSCRLGSDIIRGLKLDFSCLRSNRKYGTVPYVYPDNEPTLGPITNMKDAIDVEDLKTQSGLVLSNPVDVDQIAEEWDRFEALHNDPYDVDRSSKHSLKYESRIKLKWEKGGPGLVHYTDEMFWRERESVRRDEFFDEPSSFDWDINLHQYSDDEGLSFAGPGGPDLDSKQLSQILDDPIEECVKPFLSAYGAKIMQNQGWRRGTRLGDPKRRGLLEPITSEDGSVSTNRSGLGFTVSSFRSPFTRVSPRHTSGAGFQPISPEKRFVINSPYSSRGIEGVKFRSGGVIGLR
ncbi:unnamed protein product [Hydatigera taeniaeformis]|uniref:G-patch domain-containing protein n=1 Tax=Hydatigena taeniaeformis TaxID=6205 RepID=A0A0R3WPJ8_HYDTA|nr:unnamed protein product [Hydatigera taeniaeformis]